MALKILQPGIQPLGQFDVLDGYLDSIKGGEVGTLTSASRTNTASETAAADVLDGYVNVSSTLKRAAVTLNIHREGVRPLWLLDDGKTGYGTLFGQVIGTSVGLKTSGTNLGPHSAAASGKVTCWDKDGLYGVTLDAMDTSASDGMTPTNTSLSPGDALYITSLGLITPTSGSSVGTGAVVGRFVEFETTAVSLVRTPASLVGAAEEVEYAVISYHVE